MFIFNILRKITESYMKSFYVKDISDLELIGGYYALYSRDYTKHNE